MLCLLIVLPRSQGGHGVAEPARLWGVAARGVGQGGGGVRGGQRAVLGAQHLRHRGRAARKSRALVPAGDTGLFGLFGLTV